MLRYILLTGFVVSASCSAPRPSSDSSPDFGNTLDQISQPVMTPNIRPEPGTFLLSKPTSKNSVANPRSHQLSPSSPSSTEPKSEHHRTPAQVAAQEILPLSYHSSSSQGLTISAVYYDDRKFQLQVADQPKGCGSIWLDAKSAGLSRNAVAAINAGFFTPEGKPLGLVVESGTQRGYLNQSSLGSGIYAATASGCSITRRDSSTSSKLINKATHLLQAGPILIENGIATKGLSVQRNRPRSFIAWDGNHHWMLGHIDTATLSGAAQALALAKHPAVKFKSIIALNLDGGRSSDLWVGAQVANGNKSHRTFLNKVVRNYLVLTTR